MAESNQNEIIKMIEGLSESERNALIKSLQDKEVQPRTKVRRKHYKKEQFQAEIKNTKPTVTHRPKKDRPNLFESSPLFNANKTDSEVDKKLWANHQPTERDRKSHMVRVQCSVCGTQQTVSSSLVFKSAANEVSQWTCNKCLTGKASRS